MKIIHLVILNLVLCCTACYHRCDDITAHHLTETDMDWFSFEIDDTVFFRDAQSGGIYYLVCVGNTTKIVTEFVSDEEDCSHGGYYNTYDQMKSVFNSNFLHFDGDSLLIEMSAYTNGEFSLNGELLFINKRLYPSLSEGYIYRFKFDNQSQIIRDLYPGGSELSHLESIEINGTTFENISKIYCESCDDRVYYDTLYFNKDGFLKFSSSQFGNELERMP